MDRQQMQSLNSRTKEENSLYFAATLMLMLICNRLIFLLGHFLTLGTYHWNLNLPADAKIPFLPWTVIFYNGMCLWWLYIYWLMAHRDRKEANRFFCTLLMSKAVSFLFFVLFPTSISRPELNGNSIWIVMLQILYRLDTPDNLFPSIHCIIGWTCWLGVRGKRDISFFLRATSFLLAVAVCISTLTVRQNVILDVFAGILLSEICYSFSDWSVFREFYSQVVRLLFQSFTQCRDAIIKTK